MFADSFSCHLFKVFFYHFGTVNIFLWYTLIKLITVSFPFYVKLVIFFLFNRVWLLFMDQEEFLFAQKKLKSCAHVSCCWDTHAFMNRMCDDGLGLTFVSRSDLTLESASSRVRLSYREKERFPPNCYIIYIFYSFIPIPPSSPTWKIQFFH